MNIFNKNFGFTLAEILITVGIIGIVAEMTIPTLMQNFQDQQYRTAWKKEFSVLSQATAEIKNDNGGTLQNIFTGHDQMKNTYKSYLLNTSDCSSSDSNCYYTYKYFNGTTSYTSQRAILYLNDGSMFAFALNNTTCNTVSGSSGIPSCGVVIIDVNGSKPPNMIAKDLYVAWITKDGVVPCGTQNDAGNYAGCPGNMGYGCSAYYLYN